ncbi:MAG: hypothetical protein WAV89_12555 [Ignavibacteriaceae bacterium]
MRTIYLRVEKNGIVRKIAIDMAFLAKHNIIRLQKYYYEEGLYLPYKNLKNNSAIENYFLTKDKSFKDDSDFYYFKFPFKMKQVMDTAS